MADKVTELDWFQEACVDVVTRSGASDRALESTDTLVDAQDAPCRVKIACTPAQHRSGRGFFDQHASLWCTWVVGVLPEDSVEHSKDVTDAWTYGLPSSGFRCFFGGYVVRLRAARSPK